MNGRLERIKVIVGTLCARFYQNTADLRDSSEHRTN
jgi:hypothetical protein